ncbi:hypothetical protein BOO69_15705 [Sulfitobacter alexandrii]|uniref:DUF2946 domain-containing protein n=1 Tax=Sulfitobacter alexandrii TaxID=1917485 RepID=A0A1J0WK45_9RHOB|nr:hypothetical protein [Sulfitobacter alexandrii]APE44690.1 hypothetical protein BOO69_15705 [Sulfitobacter alexandrii]
MTAAFAKMARRAGLWLMLAPFLVLSLISDAVMPVATDRGIRMVLCTGTEMVEILVDPDSGQPVDPSDADDTPPRCDWSAAHPAFAPAAPTVIAAIAANVTVIAPAIPPTILSHAGPTGLPPATGPPATI